MLTLLENNIEKAFTGFFSLFEYDYEKSLKFDNISIDTTERKIIYNINNSLIKTNRVIKTSLINMIDTDEELLLSLDKNNIQFKIDCDNDYYIVYDGSLSVVFTNYIQNLQMVKIANLELLVSGFEIVRKEVVADYIAYYPFTNGSLNDLSSNGYNLTNTNAITTTGVKGIANTAYLFNGSNAFLSSAVAYTFGLNNKITISFWVKLTDLSLTYNNFVRTGENGSNVIDVRLYSNSLQTEIATPYDYLTTTFNNPTQWNFICMTYEATTIKLYINDANAVTKTTTQKALANNTWRIGRSTAQGLDDTPRASITNVRFYDRIITASEVLQIYNFEK